MNNEKLICRNLSYRLGLSQNLNIFQENSINTIFILGQLCNCYLSEWNMHRSTKMFVCFVFVILEGNIVLRMLTNFSAIYKHVILVLQKKFFLAVRKRRLLLKNNVRVEVKTIFKLIFFFCFYEVIGTNSAIIVCDL